jgi:hypothetical protein
MAKFRKFFSFPHFLAAMAIAALVGLGGRAFTGLPFWVCFAIAVLAILVNGWLATWEDNQPGGFNNPTDQGP